MKFSEKIIMVLITLLPLTVHAGSVGEISQMVTYLLSEISTLANVVLFITGGAFCISALIKFQEFHRSPQNIPISRPITELIVGIILFALPFIFSKTVQNAVFGNG